MVGYCTAWRGYAPMFEGWAPCSNRRRGGFGPVVSLRPATIVRLLLVRRRCLHARPSALVARAQTRAQLGWGHRTGDARCPRPSPTRQKPVQQPSHHATGRATDRHRDTARLGTASAGRAAGRTPARDRPCRPPVPHGIDGPDLRPRSPSSRPRLPGRASSGDAAGIAPVHHVVDGLPVAAAPSISIPRCRHCRSLQCRRRSQRPSRSRTRREAWDALPGEAWQSWWLQPLWLPFVADASGSRPAVGQSDLPRVLDRATRLMTP